MLNATVNAVCALGAQMMLEQILRDEDLPKVTPEALRIKLSEDDVSRIQGWMNIAEKVANDFECQPAKDRIDIIRTKIARGMNHRELSVELRVLRETIDNGLKNQFVYRYPDEKAKVLKTWKTDWADTIRAFPSAKRDILECVDTWAMMHPTASVFHAMRVLEHGLRALAAEVNRTFDIQNWQNIIEEIEREIRERQKKLPRGNAKNEQLQFLSEAAKEFTYFKDGWRNYVSHNRADYDEHQARSVHDHVRSFMTVLSSRLREVAVP